ncbi:potassium/proton antiporter [Aneurinibacillus sp. REN35]|uniref:potassium/proton antiporter n=1 Tax=Aneurinibacillus sp. REN35 TaxID=3237286 RepID=UPI0035291417
MTFTIDGLIFLFAILLLTGVVTAKFSSRLGVPSLVFFIVVGMVLNRFVFYNNAYLTQLFGILALIIILFDGGMQTKWANVRPVATPALSLATVGVLLTTFIVGICTHYILGLPWLESMLLGSIVGSTDAAAVFAVLGNKNIKKRLSSTLEAESGTNDPMAVFLTISFIELIQVPDASVLSMILNFFWQMGFGLVAGLLIGFVAVKVVNKINLDSSGLYPVLALAFAIFTYSATAVLNGSGLLAVYVMAVYMGNADLTYRHAVSRFNEGFAWMMQILMFILLGLLVFPNELIHIAWQGIALSFLLIFVARPIGVFISTIAMKFSFKEKIFISWAGLRGAVPIVLATYPLIAGLEDAQLIFNVVFFVVLTSALIQGSTISPLARAFGLSQGEKPITPHTLELVSISKTSSEMIEITIPGDGFIANENISDLTLPKDVLITAVIRGEELITPTGDTQLLEKDILYVLVPKIQRERVKQLFLSKPKNSL